VVMMDALVVRLGSSLEDPAIFRSPAPYRRARAHGRDPDIVPKSISNDAVDAQDVASYLAILAQDRAPVCGPYAVEHDIDPVSSRRLCRPTRPAIPRAQGRCARRRRPCQESERNLCVRVFPCEGFAVRANASASASPSTDAPNKNGGWSTCRLRRGRSAPGSEM